MESTMNLRARVYRLERQALRRRLSIPDDDPLEEDWLLMYEDWANQGMFVGEPDFPVALAAYRQALAEAKQGQPSWYPPADFEPGQRTRQRFASWRHQHHYPAVNKTWLWLSEFFDRVRQGLPPVTRAEFQELANWFEINQKHLTRLEGPSELVAVSGGRRTCLTNLRYGLLQGYQARGVGRLAEDLRHLRTCLG
jgi:hypothetical protein